MAGIKVVEDADGNFNYERELTDREIQDYSVSELNESGIFSLYSIDHEDGAEFIRDALMFGLEAEARAICSRHPY